MIARLAKAVIGALLALVLAWLAVQPGWLELRWLGWHVATAPGWALLALLIVLAIPLLLGRLYTAIRYRSGLFGPGRMLRRARAAELLATRALADLLLAQSERAAGQAATALGRVADDPLALFVAARLGDKVAADRLAAGKATARLAAIARYLHAPGIETTARLVALAPDSPAAWAAAFAEHARAGQWEEATAALDKWTALDPADAAAMATRRAAVATAAALAATDDEVATDWARRAARAAPGFVPGVVMAARRLAARDRRQKAASLILAAWDMAPHPELAEAYAALDPTETAHHRLERFRALAASHPDHPESRMRLAEAALGAGEALAALEALAPLLAGAPRARAAHLAAIAHRQLGIEPDPHARWPEALVHGAAEPDWRCDACHAHAPHWSLVCPSCAAVATLAWTEVPAGMAAPRRIGG